MLPTIEVDLSELQQLADDLKIAPQKAIRSIHKSMNRFGPKAVRAFRKVLEKNTYTGQLMDSVSYDYSESAFELEAGTTLKRGNFDGGSILEYGTRPIPNVPWRPLYNWAVFKGFDNPFALVAKIRGQGVNPHPFVQKVWLSGEFQRALRELDKQLGDDVVATVVVKY